MTWHNPMIVPEPHTAAFLKDPNYFPPPAIPFSISNISELKPVVPVPNNEPLIVANESGASAVVVDNARHYTPVAIDSTGSNRSEERRVGKESRSSKSPCNVK